MKKPLSPRGELLAYLAVGGVNTLFGYGIYAAAVFFGLNYFLAVLVSQILGALFNYFTYTFFVFKKTPRPTNLFFFLVLYGLLYGLAVGNLTLLHWAGLNLYIAGLVNMLCIPALSFIANKYLVFSGKGLNE